MTSNYGFLEMLHRELKPRGYLEIGVRYGDSLRLAQCPAIGIDPNPQMIHGPEVAIFSVTSDRFFEAQANVILGHPYLDGEEFFMDLVYIDGMHLYEYALRDFINMARWANERTVVVFDDTHPYNQAIATREQRPGDWTGDVWKVMELIQDQPSMWAFFAQVDVSPAGAFVMWNINREGADWFRSRLDAGNVLTAFQNDDIPVPDDVLDRRHTISPEEAIKRILESRT